MYDYIRELGKQLSEDDLIEVFGMTAILNEQPYCKDWMPLIGAVGVQGMLSLSEQLGGKTIQIPDIYQVLVVYAALMVVKLSESVPYSQAKEQVIGRLYLNGFDELVDKIRAATARLVESPYDNSSG